MGRPADPELRRSWRERLSRQATSRVSVAEFCREEGVSEASFYGWRKRLGRGAGANGRLPTDERRGSRRRAPGGPREPEVRFVQLPLSALPHSAAVELRLTDGTVIRVPSDASAALQEIMGIVLDRAAGSTGEVRHD